jgi:hypothetical protein
LLHLPGWSDKGSAFQKVNKNLTTERLASAGLTFSINETPFNIVKTALLHRSTTHNHNSSSAYATSTTWKFAVARQSFPGSTLILRFVMAFSTHTKRS